MRIRTILAATALLLFVAQAKADEIPYANLGSVAPTVPLTAVATGNITGYFYGVSAADTDYIRMIDLTTNTASGWLFGNQTTAVGASADFGSVNMGDVLEFQIKDVTSGLYFSSNPSDSSDGANHAYVTSSSGSGTIPAGTFVGMEDLPLGSSDLDYNDLQFVFTNVGTTPEPSSLFLLGTGLLGLVELGRRKLLA